MKRALTLIALGALVLPLALASPAAAQKLTPVRISVHSQFMGAPDVIAIRQGYYKAEGLDVQPRRFSLGKEGRDAMVAGALDINPTATTPFMIGLDKGVPYSAIAVNSYFCGTNHVAVLKSSDINSVAQLKGKKIGLPKGTITDHIFMTKIAAAHGLNPKTDFQVANMPDAKDRIPSLVAKAVDAVAIADPFVAIAEHEGIIRTIDNFCKYDPLPFMLTATNRMIKEQPDVVVAYLRGWLRAVKLLQQEPEKAAAVYAEEQKELGRTVNLAVLDKALRRMKWEPEITGDLERYLSAQARDLITEKKIAKMPDFSKGLTKDLVVKAKAGR